MQIAYQVIYFTELGILSYLNFNIIQINYSFTIIEPLYSANLYCIEIKMYFTT